ncbi:putative alpha/beta hydrolase [[Mycobacterium] zoologicum]|uniref:putative alpha/beta hydrolase n=1 Tax=[Mycobacterium] zoologicum TaxID=2872311 RepID=UPI001CDABE9D|nr:hypothetical protein [Mycolicibacter sp. MYC101]MEB3064176.1 hypothetical protein [Mycolicibacter sp. MYC101]
MQLQHLNLPWLIEAAGGDPWQVNSTLQSGNPGVVDELAQAFHNAALCTSESSAAFTEAGKRFRAAWNRENGEHPINDSLEVQRATQTLHLQQNQLLAIGTDLENIAAALAEAQRDAADKIAALETQLQNIDDHIGVYLDADADVSDLVQMAADDTAGILHQIEKIRDDYAATLQAATAKLLSDGYDPVALHGYDGDGQPTLDQQTDRAADAYGTTQRDHDQQLVDEPGEMTPEKAEAAARLRDYATVSDPAADPDARRLAGERLDDFRMANFVGQLPPDMVLGGDARSNAANRLDMQRRLESGTVHPDIAPMTPDQATRALDEAETVARAWTLTSFADRLRNSGVSPGGVTRAVTAIRNGIPAREFFDQLSNASGSVGKGLAKYGEVLSPADHRINPSAYTKADAAALAKFGRNLGGAATVLDGALTLIDVVNGDISPKQGVAEFGGRWAGGAVGGWGALVAMSFLVAPEIAVPVAVAGGVIGGSKLGQTAVDKLLGY